MPTCVLDCKASGAVQSRVIGQERLCVHYRLPLWATAVIATTSSILLIVIIICVILYKVQYSKKAENLLYKN